MSLNACLVARYDKLGREAQQTTRSDVADGLTPIDHYDGQDEPPYRNPPVSLPNVVRWLQRLQPRAVFSKGLSDYLGMLCARPIASIFR
jgi:hypothetical protein